MLEDDVILDNSKHLDKKEEVGDILHGWTHKLEAKKSMLDTVHLVEVE